MFPAPYQSSWMPNQLQAMQNIMRMRQKATSGGGQVLPREGFLPGDRPMPMPAPQDGTPNPVFSEQAGLPKKRRPLSQVGGPYRRQAPRNDYPQNQGGFDPRLMDFV